MAEGEPLFACADYVLAGSNFHQGAFITSGVTTRYGSVDGSRAGDHYLMLWYGGGELPQVGWDKLGGAGVDIGWFGLYSRLIDENEEVVSLDSDPSDQFGFRLIAVRSGREGAIDGLLDAPLFVSGGQAPVHPGHVPSGPTVHRFVFAAQSLEPRSPELGATYPFSCWRGGATPVIGRSSAFTSAVWGTISKPNLAPFPAGTWDVGGGDWFIPGHLQAYLSVRRRGGGWSVGSIDLS